jgi:hypothetical protein
MAKQPTLLFDGATYFVTGTTEYKDPVCKTEDEYVIFLNTLEEAVMRFGWELYAFSLTKEYYYLLVGTPKGNLSESMQYFQSHYANRVHRARGTSGYFFRKYQAVGVEVTDENLTDLSTLIHIKPVAEKCVNLKKESLFDYLKSSCRFYLRPSDRPAWLSVLPVLRAQGFGDDRSGLTRYRNRLRKVLKENTTKAGAFRLGKSYVSLQQEWAVGSDEFKDKLLDLLEGKLAHISENSITGGMKKAYELRHTERCFKRAVDAVGLSVDELGGLKKSDIRKQAVCWYLKQHTKASSAWLCAQLHMGASPNISKGVRAVSDATEGPLLELRNTLQKL